MLVGHVDFNTNNGTQPSGHWHDFPDGDIKSGHSGAHLSPDTVPEGWSVIPKGYEPKIPIGKL